MNSFWMKAGLSKPKVYLEEYLDSFFPPKSVLLLPRWSESFYHTANNFWEAFQSYCLSTSSGSCSVPPFPRAGVSKHSNLWTFSLWANLSYIMYISSRWPSSSRAWQMNTSPALYLCYFLNYDCFQNWSELLVHSRGVSLPCHPPSYFTQGDFSSGWNDHIEKVRSSQAPVQAAMSPAQLLGRAFLEGDDV